MDKSKLKTIVITAIVTFVATSLVFFLFFNNETKIINKDLTSGHYIAKAGDTETTLDVDGKQALLTLYGIADTGTINNSKKTIKFNTQSKDVKFDIISGKVVLTVDNYSIPFEKAKDTSSSSIKTSSSETKSSKSASSSSTTDTSKIPSLEKVKEETENSIGLSIKLAEEKMNSLETTSEYETSIYVEYLDDNGDSVYSYDDDSKDYKVTKVLSVEKDSDTDYDVKFVVSK